MFPHVYLSIAVSPEALARKRARGLCRHYRCKRVARPRALDCETCCSRKTRMRNPVRYAFKNLKSSAAKRDIAFELTYAEFAGWAAKHDYIARRGKLDDSLSVDRIETNGPYALWNIRPLGYLDNCSHKHEGVAAELADF